MTDRLTPAAFLSAIIQEKNYNTAGSHILNVGKSAERDPAYCCVV